MLKPLSKHVAHRLTDITELIEHSVVSIGVCYALDHFGECVVFFRVVSSTAPNYGNVSDGFNYYDTARLLRRRVEKERLGVNSSVVITTPEQVGIIT